VNNKKVEDVWLVNGERLVLQKDIKKRIHHQRTENQKKRVLNCKRRAVIIEFNEYSLKNFLKLWNGAILHTVSKR
jgi:hypothetical protein